MGTGVGELALLQAAGVGAATGAATSALTGGDPLKGALLGGLTGGAGAGLAGAGAGAAGGAGAGGAGAAGAGGASTAVNTATNLGTTAATDLAAQNALNPEMFVGDLTKYVPQTATDVATRIGPTNLAAQSGQLAGQTAVNQPMTALGEFYARNPIATPAGLGALGSVIGDRPGSYLPEEEEYDGPLSKFRYSPSTYRPARVASGGLMDSEPARRMMAGGKLGSYSDGGQTLKGPGDGMSDSIPAKIGSKQPARLADGEFVVPADVVSGIGNGSTDAGARRLYAMMDKVRVARTGNKKQGREIDPDKYMPS